ncbi:hypothetical protein FHX49_000853 [Microbacterium endophyticum]|uniref:Uncharacterized protein n=1 Tax=Microbacterium endophyticum TaxID=1526412 RepID=A0A7W4V1R6_9MICO|nr:hypothetical protein [Microbacterium endophyticum]MBB2975287.1 hypothetical protein [Microbacterium endophyticum]NIK35694.1 hypothetical protein [Microbacterium endophyticum]
MEPWVEDAAKQIEKLLGDPMADAVRGRVQVLSVSERVGRAAYQECRVEVRAEAPGMEPATVQTTGVFNRAHWPKPGTIYPAAIAPQHPSSLEVNWESPHA